MLKLAVLVSGSGTNLQAIIDRIEDGSVRNAKIEVVISNNPNAYALTRAKNHGICARCISPKSFETREAFNDALLEALTEAGIDLVVLAGFMVVVPPAIISKFRNKIIIFIPSLIHLFADRGYYDFMFMRRRLKRALKSAALRCILLMREQTRARLLCKKRSKSDRAIRRKLCSGGLWSRPNGSSCLRSLMRLPAAASQ